MNSVWEKINWSLNQEDVLKETLKLINAGADVNAKCEDGEPPLRKAIFHRHLKCAIQLIKAGADVNAKNKEGKTALKCVLGRMGLVTTQLIGSDKRVAENLMDKIDQIEQLLKAGYRQTTLKNLVALRKEFASDEMKKIIPDMKNRLKARAIAVKRIERGRE